MPIEIRLLKDYQLRTKDNEPDTLLLPVIALAPSEESNVPHISSITISVRGTPEDLAKQIQSAYRVFSNSKPIKLYSEQRLRQSDCRLVQPFPTDFSYTLEVSIDYFDSDAAGNPNWSAPKNVKAECYMRSASVEKKPQVQSFPTEETPTEETTQPLVANTPQVQSFPTKETPTEETTQPLVANTVPVRSFQLNDATQPRVSRTENDYPGWFAIDFGTSNSTVTLYDPKVVDPPKNLPQEQDLRLRLRLAEWVNQRPTDDLIHFSVQDWQSEWEKLLQEVSRNFQDSNPNNRDNLGDQIFSGTDSTHLLEAIRLIEISLNSCKDWFSRSASKQLNQIYYEVSRMPPLEWQGLIPVELDGVRHEQEIPSELKIEGLDDSFTVTVLMGKRARQDREDALASSQDINEIKGKFYHSPKRYFGQQRDITVTLNGKAATIPVQNLIQAAYAHLIQLTDDYRNAHPNRCAVGNFYTGVLTYPTIAPPAVRREIEELVKNLGIKDVQTAYDEAVSVAIFYLLREFGGDLNIGIESFKTRCRRQGDKWSQNVLILDIGGGTTDIALIRLTLEEIDPFTSDEDRGYGGRYYRLTPKLLGSSGHLQLGGELITLRIFLLLKAAIADCLLTEVTQGRLERDVLKIGINELNERFLKNSEFQSGTLLACVDKYNPEADVSYKDALDDAEKVLSTRFQKSPSRLQTFYTLWEHAERAKLILGQKPKTKDTTEPTFSLNGRQIAELLFEPNNTLSPSQSLDNLSVELTVQQFEKAVTPVLKEAIGIAQGLMENCLKDDKQPVDWLILSGKTCNLDLVDQELYTKFSNSQSFVWNRERITFVPEYSKLATSIGACYAEKLRRLSFDPQQAKPLLRKGANQLYFDVKNLLYFLPCSFYREAIGAEYRIFETGDKLSLVDPSESLVKIRSSWQGVQLSNIIQRQDFEGMTPQLWGSYNGKALAVVLNMEEFEFLKKINVQFEVDQKLEFSLLFCQGNPHYLIGAKIPSLNASDKIGTHPLISNENQVVCDIAICVAESAHALNTDAHTTVFEAGKDYSKDLKVFCNEDGTMQQQKGLISDPLPPFPLSGEHSFYFQFRDPTANSWQLIGELPKPEINTEYPCNYYVTLDEQGILRIHAGEVPYRKANTIEDLKQAGCVFRTGLDLQPPELEDNRNPFSGIH